MINDDVVEPGQGFGEHPHRDMEILTWVLSGSLKHGDNLGHLQVLQPGELQAMTAGKGIIHSEFNASETELVHFLQVWLMPRKRNATPNYEQVSFEPTGRQNQWQTLASGFGKTSGVSIETDAAMHVADLSQGVSLPLQVQPDRSAYVHVATGELEVDGESLSAGDALVVTSPGALTLTTSSQAQVLWFELV